jgi:hypothetical protein
MQLEEEVVVQEQRDHQLLEQELLDILELVEAATANTGSGGGAGNHAGNPAPGSGGGAGGSGRVVIVEKTTTLAPGVWSLKEQFEYKKQGIWT